MAVTSLKIETEAPPTARDREILVQALLSHNGARFGDPVFTPVGLFLRDSAGTIHGGLTARLRWGWLYIEMLWIAEDLRGQGYGSRLLDGAEAFALARGGIAAHLESGGVEVLGFYERRGYQIVGVMDGFPPGTRQHFLRKWLVPSAKQPVDQ
jgi:GNAT superfamily N-acetyltransferase